MVVVDQREGGGLLPGVGLPVAAGERLAEELADGLAAGGEGAVPDVPVEGVEQLGLDGRQAKDLAGTRDVVRHLAVDDAGRGIVKQPFRQLALATALGAGRVQVREPVHDDDVLHAVAA